MKKIYHYSVWIAIIFLGVVFVHQSFAQEAVKAQQAFSTSFSAEQGRKSYRLCGTLEASDPENIRKAIERTRLYKPEVYAEMVRLQKTRNGERTYLIGERQNFFTSNYVSNTFDITTAELRASGTVADIWVDTLELKNGHVTDFEVQALLNGLETSTPSASKDPAKGIIKLDNQFFGNPPNIDVNGNKGAGNGKVTFLVYDIKDSFNPPQNPTFIAGYFSSNDQRVGNYGSNKRDMLYIDSYPGIYINGTRHVGDALVTMSHEYQHLIHYNYDPTEQIFVNEGFSMYAEIVCGYGLGNLSDYLQNTNVSLFSWSKQIADYARAQLWTLYLCEQGSDSLAKKIVQNTSHGITGIDQGLTAVGSPLRFNDVFNNWTVANILNDRSVNPAYGYLYPNVPKAVGRLYANPNVPSTTGSAQNLAMEYLTFKYGSQLRATFTTENPAILIKAVEIGPSQKRVLDVTPNVEFFEPGYGTTYKEIHLVILNTNQNLPYGYTFRASGIGTAAIELKWDETEPIGFLRLSPSDTLCVTFDAVPGGKLDSIRVALRRKGSIVGGVWQYTGQLRPTPLGKPLAMPITASTDITPPVINPGAEYPYPIPYPGWCKVDLRSYNISTDQPFAVGFVVQVYDTPAVLVTKYPGGSAYHSFTYLNNPSSGESNWFYITSNDNNVYIYLIRAYVGFGGEVILPSAPTLVSPPNGATEQPLNVMLSWNATPGVTSYRLQVSTSSTFTTKLVDDSTLTTTYREVGPLEYNTTYYWRVSAKNAAGSSSFSQTWSFKTIPAPPAAFYLKQNYPNPFNLGTIIQYGVPVKAHVKLLIFDLLGREVITLVDAEQTPRHYEVKWDGKDASGGRVASGVYAYRLKSGNYAETKKMILTK